MKSRGPLLIAPLALAAAACGSPRHDAPASAEAPPPAGDALVLTGLDVVTGLARTPARGAQPAAWLAFTVAPGGRTAIVSSSDGRAWERVALFDRSGIVYGTYFSNDGRGYALHGGAGACVLYATDDGGRTWTQAFTAPGRYLKLFADGGDLLLAGSDASGRASVLRGAAASNVYKEWAEFEGRAPALVAGVASCRGRTFLAGGGGGLGTLHAAAPGAKFAPLPVGEIPNLLSIDFDADGNGLAVGARGEALRSRDGGATWEPTLSGTDRDLSCVAFLAPRRALACGRDGTVLITADAGGRFERIDSGRRDDLLGFVRAPGVAGVYALGVRGFIPYFNGR